MQDAQVSAEVETFSAVRAARCLAYHCMFDKWKTKLPLEAMLVTLPVAEFSSSWPDNMRSGIEIMHYEEAMSLYVFVVEKYFVPLAQTLFLVLWKN